MTMRNRLFPGGFGPTHFSGAGSPIFGGPARRPVQVPQTITDARSVLWRSNPTSIVLGFNNPAGRSLTPLAASSDRVGMVTIFAELTNTVPVQIGNRDLRASLSNIWDSVSFQLDAGRSATIWVDDYMKEAMDLSTLFGMHADVNANQLLYVTSWRPIFS